MPKTEQLQKLAKNLIHNLRDVRVVGLWVFAAVVLLVTWSSIGIIQANYELQKQIASLQNSVDNQKLANSNQRLRNQYYETNHYLELQARRQFNKAAPGESLLIVPKNVALAHSLPEADPIGDQPSIQKPDKPAYQQNFEAWMDFLFRRDLKNY